MAKLVELPVRVDEPLHLLLWSIDEIAPMLLGLVVGMMIGKALICFLIGFCITKLYILFRDNHADGYLLHLIYWYGFLPSSKSKSLINPYIRKLLP